MEERKRYPVEFRGGQWWSVVPMLIFLVFCVVYFVGYKVFDMNALAVGGFLGLLIGALFCKTYGAYWDAVLRGIGSSTSVSIVVILLVILFAKAELPDLRSSEEADEAAMMKHSLLAHKEFVAGVAAQFLYVAAQVGIGAFFINLYIECWPGGTAQQGAFFLSIAMLCLLIGRFVSTGIMTKIAPAKLLAVYGVVCVILTGVVFTAVEYVSVIALIAVFFFISIMFPTIFAMGTRTSGPARSSAART